MSLVTELRSRRHADRLDAAIVAGAEPWSSPELAARCERLTSRAYRDMLATRLENAVRLPRGRLHVSRATSSAVIDPAPMIALFAGDAVRRLARRLRVAARPDPRGVALALALVKDGASPLYLGPTVGDVRDAVARIEHAL
jgi:hypothetical protein